MYKHSVICRKCFKHFAKKYVYLSSLLLRFQKLALVQLLYISRFNFSVYTYNSWTVCHEKLICSSKLIMKRKSISCHIEINRLRWNVVSVILISHWSVLKYLLMDTGKRLSIQLWKLFFSVSQKDPPCCDNCPLV